jgi:mannose-6-phosphate isomerase class I
VSYDLRPCLASGEQNDAALGWPAIGARLLARQQRFLIIESYPGVCDADLRRLTEFIGARTVIDASQALKPEGTIRAMTAADMGEDPVFGRLTHLELDDFFDHAALLRLRATLQEAEGCVCVIGVGASLVAGEALLHANDCCLVYAYLPRWEATCRQRRGEVTNLGLDNRGESPSSMYKRGYFIDWRVADRHRRHLWPLIDMVLDTADGSAPVVTEAARVWQALEAATRRPFRFVPHFDPAPWGGHWMQSVCDTGHDRPNLGWCFDCVAEENSLLLGFGEQRFQIPGIELVLREPDALLGEAVVGRFGAEFPIRTDFLDTMGGGNLSLQVHPLTEYMHQQFGLSYTQDESYYILDAAEDATVHLGVIDGVDPDALAHDLHMAQEGDGFPVKRHINSYAARKHDHFLIPAGTVHGSGAGTMVLEISATPYIFTFKLHDWNRPGLNGRPRPLHIERGLANLVWQRDTSYARARLINRITPIDGGQGWSEERTGLHEAEFIETRRHWFSVPVVHRANGRFAVLTVVEGDGIVIDSADGGFSPFCAAYAETVVLPAAAGSCRIRPITSGQRCATIKAFVRTEA